MRTTARRCGTAKADTPTSTRTSRCACLPGDLPAALSFLFPAPAALSAGARFRPQATHPNRGKVEKKLAGPGFSKITKSYSTKFKDDPDPVRHAPAPIPAAFPNAS